MPAQPPRQLPRNDPDGTAAPAGTPPGTAAAPLQAVASGIFAGAAPLQFMDSIDAGNRQLGNRAFLRWVGKLQAAHREFNLPRGATHTPQGPNRVPAENTPLQFGPRKRKKKGAPTEQVTPAAVPEAAPPAGAAAVPEPEEALPRAMPGVTAIADEKKKKKKKSRGQATGQFAVPPVKKELDVREKELFECCYDGRVSRLKVLLRHGRFEINASNHEGTMLGVAAHFGHTAVLEALLGVPGIDVNLLQQRGYTPLYIAVDKNREKIVRLLLAADNINVNLGVPGKYTPLHLAVTLNHELIVRLLLAHPGINVNVRKPNGSTPLLIAAQENLPRIVELLLNQGADVNLGLRAANSLPLLVATVSNHVEVVTLLLEQRDIRVNETTRDGLTALCVASQNGYEEIVRLLLGKGADPNIPTNKGATPLHLAVLYRHPAILAMLLDAGADIQLAVALAGEKFSVFEIALLIGDRELIGMLEEHLENGPDWSTPPSTPPPQWSTPPSTPPPEWFTGSPPMPPPAPSATLTTAEAVPPTPAPPVLRSADTGAAKPPDTKPTAGAAERLMPHRPAGRPGQAEAPSPLSAAKNALIAEVLRKLDNQTLDPVEGIWLMADVRAAANIDLLCVLYNRLAGMERERRRSRRHRSLRQNLLAEETEAAPAHAAPCRYTVGKPENLDADAAEAEIRQHLAPAHHRFISQAVNDMEFGRGKPTSGHPGLLHASAGIPGVGSCSVFYHADVERRQNRIVGIGRHLDRETYQLDYAAGELRGRRTLRLS